MNLDLPTITAFGSILTPVLLAIFAGVGWTIQRRVEKSFKIEEEARERSRRLEENLRDERLRVYNAILEPFIMLFTKDDDTPGDTKRKGKSTAQTASELASSLQYRQTAFKLCLFASDDVVKAYNKMMQYLYNDFRAENENSLSKHQATAKLLAYFGDLLLEIRKSSGNEKSTLNNIEMLEWLMTDIRRYYPEQ